jgi:hypothetical protein
MLALARFRPLLVLVLMVLCAGLIPPAPASAQAGLNPVFLQALGKDLYWNNRQVILKGTNFDNINALGAGIGTNNVNDIVFTNADYARVAQEGANHVRLGLSFSWYQNQQTAFFAKMDEQVSYARANGIFLVFNMFTTPGNCYEGYGTTCGFWTNAGEQNALRNFWVAMATRYKNEPAVAGYDMLNEPTPGSGCQTWGSIAATIVTAIRQVNQNQLIFFNTCSDPGNDLRYNNPPRGPNIVWQVHEYGPMGFSHNFTNPGASYPGTASDWFGSCYIDKNEFAGVTNNCNGYMNVREHWGLNYAASQNMPIYIGEWGSTSRLTGYVQYHKDKAELYRDWGVHHAHYTWRHQTIVTGGYYQWGISSTTGGVDDTAKLNAVKIAWVGAVRPNFGTGAVTTSTAIATQTPTNTPTRLPTLTPTATFAPGTPTRTPTPAPPTNTPTNTATPTNTPANTATPTNTAAPVASSQFYRGINLNGGAQTVDGNAWVSPADAGLTTNGSGFVATYLNLSPSVTGGKKNMLQRWVQHWAWTATLPNVPNGDYSVYLYVVQDWNDPAPATVTFTVEGVTAGTYTPGSAGSWSRRGPYTVTMSDGTMNFSANDLVNVAGIEIFKAVSATPTPTNTPTATPEPTNTPGPTAVPQGNASFTMQVTINVDGTRTIDIVTTARAGLTLVMDEWAPENTTIDNTVGGCVQQLGSFVCWFGGPGTISLTVPENVTYIHAMQASGNGVRTWRSN